MMYRRQVLAGAGGLIASLAGCTEALSTGGTGRTTHSSASDEGARDQTVSCDRFDAGRVLVVRPVATTAVYADPSRVNFNRTRLESRLNGSILTRELGDPNDPGDAVVVSGQVAPDKLESVLEAERGQRPPNRVFRGLPAKRMERLRRALALRVDAHPEMSDDTRPRIREASGPVVAIPLPDGVKPASLMARGSFHISVVTPEHSTRVAGTNDVKRVQRVDYSHVDHAAVVLLTDDARKRVQRRVLEADASRSEITIRIVFDGETVFEGPVSQTLYTVMQQGKWEGKFLITRESAIGVTRVVVALRGGKLPYPVETTTKSC